MHLTCLRVSIRHAHVELPEGIPSHLGSVSEPTKCLHPVGCCSLRWCVVPLDSPLKPEKGKTPSVKSVKKTVSSVSAKNVCVIFVGFTSQGLFCLVDSECLMPAATDASLFSKIQNAFKNSQARPWLGPPARCPC